MARTTKKQWKRQVAMKYRATRKETTRRGSGGQHLDPELHPVLGRRGRERMSSSSPSSYHHLLLAHSPSYEVATAPNTRGGDGETQGNAVIIFRPHSNEKPEVQWGEAFQPQPHPTPRSAQIE